MGMCDCDCIENVICNAKEVLCTQEQSQIHGSQPVISAPCILKLILWLEC